LALQLIPEEIKWDPNATPPQYTDNGEQVIEKGTHLRIKLIGTRSDVGGMFAIGTIKEDYLGCVHGGPLPANHPSLPSVSNACRQETNHLCQDPMISWEMVDYNQQGNVHWGELCHWLAAQLYLPQPRRWIRSREERSWHGFGDMQKAAAHESGSGCSGQ
jgi:hypothetical protein